MSTGNKKQKHSDAASIASEGVMPGFLKPHILGIDPWLKDYKNDIKLRMQKYYTKKAELLGVSGSLCDFANGHNYFGFHRLTDGWFYREWAPASDALMLIGDFNNWNRSSHPMTKKENGIWEIFLSDVSSLQHLSRVKVHVVYRGIGTDRISPWIKKVCQDNKTKDFSGQIWEPAEQMNWTDGDFKSTSNQAPIIYESHIGMAQEKEDYGTYLEFADSILCRIKAMGYNTVQLMAVMEHPYYASFGYHVANFFSASSWFGSPDELKLLVNKAHELGISVLMDIVHSHAVKNKAEGINGFDGTEFQFFHKGKRGNHSAWDSKLFNYGKNEVIHFLLSNIKFWLEEYHFDGFRFDGVTSMIYHDHGLGTAFDNYNKYFGLNTDLDAVTYLQLANDLIKEIRPDAVSIAEDMSGMPGMCLPAGKGGIGFDFRLAMGVPDFWVRTLEKSDEDWSMHALWHELTTGRPEEKRIAYVESHDQALVGDKTFIFRIADKSMYWHMAKDNRNMEVDRAIALHKMARLSTITLGAEGYLNFMGNEFGHPEWIDFPREGNNWSFKYCKRQWSLADNSSLLYYDLMRFDEAMLSLVTEYSLLDGSLPKQLWIDDEQNVLAYQKNSLIFVYNFHPTNSLPDFNFPFEGKGAWQVIFDTDEARFGGQGRISHSVVHHRIALPSRGSCEGLSLYTPCRTAMILSKK